MEWLGRWPFSTTKKAIQMKNVITFTLIAFIVLTGFSCEKNTSYTTTGANSPITASDNDIVGDNNDSNNDEECTGNSSASDQGLCEGTTNENSFNPDQSNTEEGA